LLKPETHFSFTSHPIEARAGYSSDGRRCGVGYPAKMRRGEVANLVGEFVSEGTSSKSTVERRVFFGIMTTIVFSGD